MYVRYTKEVIVDTHLNKHIPSKSLASEFKLRQLSSGTYILLMMKRQMIDR